jgi:copper transport protein
VVVLGITAVLVAIPPGGHDHGPSAAAAVPAGPFLGSLALPGSGDVQVWVDPARTGDNQIVLNVRDERGINQDVAEVRAQLQLPAAGVGPLSVPLAKTGPGQFVADRVVVPIAGTWTLNLHVRTTEFDEITVDTQISMRQ